MRAVTVIIGILFVLLAIGGIVNPMLWGMHLTAGANAFHMTLGILGIVFGVQSTEFANSWFCWIVGATFFGLGVSGALAGAASATVALDAIRWILGAILFISGYFARGRESIAPYISSQSREKVAH